MQEKLEKVFITNDELNCINERFDEFENSYKDEEK